MQSRMLTLFALFFVLLLAERGIAFDPQWLRGNDWEVHYYDEPQLREANAEFTISAPYGYPQARDHTQLVMIEGDTKALFCCGWTGSGRLSDTWFMHTDAATEATRWEKTGAYPYGVNHHRFIPSGDATVSMISYGGNTGSPSQDTYVFQTASSAWVATAATVTANTPVGTFGGASWPLPPSITGPNNGFIVATGYSSDYVATDTVYRFALDPDQWLTPVATTGDAPSPRANPQYWTDYDAPTPKAWLYGGDDASSTFGDVYALDVSSSNVTETPYNWILYSSLASEESGNITAPSIRPGSRKGASVATVGPTGDVLVFAGAAWFNGLGGYAGDLWLFRPSEAAVGTFNGWYPVPLTGLEFVSPSTFGTNFNANFSALKPGQRYLHNSIFVNNVFYVFGGQRFGSLLTEETPPGGIYSYYDTTADAGDLWTYSLAGKFCSISECLDNEITECVNGYKNPTKTSCEYGCNNGAAACFGQFDVGAICNGTKCGVGTDAGYQVVCASDVVAEKFECLLGCNEDVGTCNGESTEVNGAGSLMMMANLANFFFMVMMILL